MINPNDSTMPGFFVFASSVLALEGDLETRFLGSDLNEICDAAANSRAPVLISTAGLPLESRNHALAVWRAARVKELLDSTESVKAFIGQAPADLVACILSGQTRLAELDVMIKGAIFDQRSREIQNRRAGKESVWGAVRGLISDWPEEDEGKPKFREMLVLASGKVDFFRYHQNCINAAKASGMAYIIFKVFSGSSVRAPVDGYPDTVSPEEEDAADEAAEALEKAGRNLSSVELFERSIAADEIAEDQKTKAEMDEFERRMNGADSDPQEGE